MYPVKVLIIDDEEDMRDLVQIYLENSGYRCFQAASASVAYTILENEQIDLVVLDIMMPEEDGFIVCEHIRSFSKVPIIFLSAKGEEWIKLKRCNLEGMIILLSPLVQGSLLQGLVLC